MTPDIADTILWSKIIKKENQKTQQINLKTVHKTHNDENVNCSTHTN